MLRSCVERVEMKTSTSAKIFGALAALAGIVASIMMCHLRLSSETQLLHDDFFTQCRELTTTVEREFQSYFDVLESVGYLHSISVDVKAEVFDEFVRKGMSYQLRILGSFGWAPRVEARDVPRFEAAMSGIGHGGYKVRSVDDSNAEPDDPIFPASYVVPSPMEKSLTGFNLYSQFRNRHALETAAEAGAPVVGDVIMDGIQSNFLRFVFAPIGKRELPMNGVHIQSSFARMTGVAFSTLNPKEVIERALEYTDADDPLEVMFLDRSGTEPILLHAEHVDDVEPFLHSTNSSLVYRQEINMNELMMLVVCRPTQAYTAMHRTLQPWILLFSGLVVTGLITYQIFALAGRTEQVQRLVDEKTVQLRCLNSNLESEITERRRLQQEILEISTLEKRRIGQDLHDSLGQQLTGISLMTSALARTLPADRADEARTIVDLLKKAKTQTRRMAKGLSPVELDEETLPDALGSLCLEMSRLWEHPIEFCCTKYEACHRHGVPVHLYHLAQEAINNAIKHSGASRIEVGLHVQNDRGRLYIEDDGHGFDPEAGYAGIGLKIMHYRAELIHAKVIMTSGCDGGCRIEINF